MSTKSNSYKQITKDSILEKTIDIRRLPRVEIRWVDAASHGGWADLSHYRDNKNISEIESLGYLTKNTKREIQLVQSRSKNGTVADSITIPKTWIISAKYLSKPR